MTALMQVGKFKVLIIIFGLYFFSPNVKGQNLARLKEQKPFSISGSLGGTMMFYGVSGRPANRKPFSWMLLGSPTISIYGITFPFSFTVSEQQRDFRQPFNKFGVSPYYRWVKLHLGYRNIVYSPYTMAGHTILGAGIELTPGNLRFGFIYGRLLKAIQPDNLAYELNNTAVKTPSFNRKAFSMKLGYGSEKNNADIILFKGWDNPESISLDTGIAKNITPAQNFILSFKTHQQLLKKINFDFEMSQSFYTDDVNESEPDSSKHQVLELFSGLFQSNSTSYSSTAIESTLGYGSKVFSMNLRYKRIAPGYRSMGAYFFQNDIRNITLEPSIRLGGQQYTIGGSLGFQRDNLDQALPATTQRTIGSISFNASPSRIYNINILYSNYDMGQSSGRVSIDSLYEISQTTQNLAINQNLNITGQNINHTFLLSLTFQKLKDKNATTANLNSFNSNTLLANYMLYLVNAGLSVNIGYNYTSFNNQLTKTKISGPSVSLSKNLMKNKLSLSVADNYFKNKILYENGNPDQISGINRISVQSGYKPSRHHRFFARFYIHNSKAISSNLNPYTERKADIGYVYTF